MDILEAIKQRHSVRAYLQKGLEEDKVKILNEKIEQLNKQSGLNVQLITEDKDAFNTMMAHYGKFSNAVNYFALVGKKKLDDGYQKVGYYGEELVLLSQMLGLNTCWVALTYNKKKNKIQIAEDEKLYCVISVGYGVNEGTTHKIKTYSQVTKNTEDVPAWFKNGVQAALLAPTAMNQQKFRFLLKDNNQVKIERGLGFYTKIDEGIVKYHFEVAAGKDNFTWT